MPYFQSTYHSRVYRDFKGISAIDYRKIIHFYEAHEEEIRGLDEDEYFEMLTAYVNSLFEVGEYRQHCLMVDLVIEASIERNIHLYRGEDLFRKMLFRKAASHYHAEDYSQAEYILKELLRMDPSHQHASLFLKKCLRQKEPGFLQRVRAASIFLFLLAALVISIEVLIVRPFYEIHTHLVEVSRYSIIALGCLVWAGGIGLHRWRVECAVNSFLTRLRKR